MVERKRVSPKVFTEALDVLPVREEHTGPGRPSEYDRRFAPIARQMCSMGATNANLADAFDVTTTTIENWLRQHTDFAEAVAFGKAEVFDPLIERSLAQLALGYSVDVEEVKIDKDGDEHRYTLRKHFAPNVTAAIFWLKNRQPDRWRDVWRVEHDNKAALEKLTAAEVLEKIREQMAELGLPLTAVPAVGVAPVTEVQPLTNGKANGTKH